jgi:hypothetical protein
MVAGIAPEIFGKAEFQGYPFYQKTSDFRLGSYPAYPMLNIVAQ